jgi:dimethylargininase
MFRNAIVRIPSPSLIYGISTAGIGKPDFALALQQHSKYTDILKRAGLTIEVLPGNELYPDSTFIEDVALCTKTCAIITSPGAESRRGETEGINDVLSKYFSKIEYISLPGTIEAGDIMMVGDHFFIGISGRTSNEGADQMTKILTKHGFTASKVPLKKFLHLKSGASYLENNFMLLCGELTDYNSFKKFNRIIVDEDESYAANSLWINGKVLVPDGFPKTREKIERSGFETITVDVSEFRKVDGGLSCLSLRF